jgi:cytochrome b561
VGNFGYFLIGAHAAAALAHHYIRRDDTLLRMLPARTRS